MDTADRKKGGPPIKDISGRRFGLLTVLEPTDGRECGAVKWLCRCDCGALVLRTFVSLRMGGSLTSCGCMKAEIARGNGLKSRNGPKRPCHAAWECTDSGPRDYAKSIADLAGRRFGKLTVVGPSGQREGTAVKFTCRCDCGNLVCRSHRVLKAGGDRASCGCLTPQIRRESFRMPDKNVDGTSIAQLENPCLRADNTSGVRGVYRCRDKWRAEITLRGVHRHLGVFDTLAEAARARQDAETALYQPLIEGYYAT